LIENNLLINEIQLDSKLSSSIHQGRRADFALMLAMLSEDVREHSQFLLPQSEQSANEVSEEQLRKQFQLPEPAPLAVKSPEDIKKFNQAQLVISHRIADLHLHNTLLPPPLHLRNDANYIAPEILENTSVHCQRRYKTKAKQNEILANSQLFNAKAWITTIENTAHSIARSNVHSIA
jgi:hypothetical protein